MKRRTLVILVIVLALLAGVDVIGRSIAQSQVASAFQNQFSLASKPTVRIGGFSFLAQALTGRYSSVEVIADGLPVDQVGKIDVDLHAQNLRIPLTRALSGNIHSVPVGHAVATVTAPMSALTERLGTAIKLKSLGGTKIELTSNVDVAGVSLPFSAQLELRVTGGVVSVGVDEVNALGVKLPTEIKDALSSKLAFTFDLPAIVSDLTLTNISVGATTFSLTVVGNNLIIQ